MTYNKRIKAGWVKAGWVKAGWMKAGWVKAGCMIAAQAMVGLWVLASPAAAELPLTVSVGAKLGGGGNFLTAPSDIDSSIIGRQATPFDDGVGGYGIGGGLYGQVLFFKGLLGVELDFLFDSSTNWSKYTVGNTEFEPGWTSLDMRIPFLISVGVPGPGVRLALGTGPEFVLPLSAEGTFEGPQAGVGFVPAAEGTSHVNWVINLGLGFPIGPLTGTFDLRFAYNLATPSTYLERYNVNSRALVAMHEMDLRLLLGVAYELPRF